MKKILIVEDETAIAENIEFELEKFKYKVISIEKTGESALMKIKDKRPDLILMDIELAGEMDGIETARKIKEVYNIPVIYLTSHSDKKIIERAKLAQPYGYLVKPLQGEELNTSIEIAIYKHKLEKDLVESNLKLTKEVDRRKTAEKKLKEYQKNLEQLVIERTSELVDANKKLKDEVIAHIESKDEIVRLLIEGLSKKEIEFMTNMSEGLGRKEISKQMDISVTTYDIHLRNIKRKLNMDGRNRIVKFAIEYRDYLK